MTNVIYVICLYYFDSIHLQTMLLTQHNTTVACAVVQGDASLVVLIGGVVRDLDWTIEVLAKKSHKSETHSDFPGCLKKRRFSPANLCVRNFPRASPGWEVPPPLPPAQITIEL